MESKIDKPSWESSVSLVERERGIGSFTHPRREYLCTIFWFTELEDRVGLTMYKMKEIDSLVLLTA